MDVYQYQCVCVCVVGSVVSKVKVQVTSNRPVLQSSSFGYASWKRNTSNVTNVEDDQGINTGEQFENRWYQP